MMIDHRSNLNPEEIQKVIDERDYFRDQLISLTGVDKPLVQGLTKTQSRIVRALEQAQGRTLTHDVLASIMTWDRPEYEIEANNIKTHICWIRCRRRDIGSRIKAVRGVGYKMIPEVKK